MVINESPVVYNCLACPHYCNDINNLVELSFPLANQITLDLGVVSISQLLNGTSLITQYKASVESFQGSVWIHSVMEAITGLCVIYT